MLYHILSTDYVCVEIVHFLFFSLCLHAVSCTFSYCIHAGFYSSSFFLYVGLEFFFLRSHLNHVSKIGAVGRIETPIRDSVSERWRGLSQHDPHFCPVRSYLSVFIIKLDYAVFFRTITGYSWSNVVEILMLILNLAL